MTTLVAWLLLPLVAWLGPGLGPAAGPVASGAPPTLASGQTATLLPDGRWLLVGGETSGGPSGAVLVWTPGGGAAVPVGRGLHTPRAWHSATVVPDGTVLVIGGWDGAGGVVAMPERIDVSAGTIQPEPIPGLTPRAAHSATLLTDGRVLVAGGLSAAGDLLTQAELWDAVGGPVEPVVSGLTAARAGHGAALLGDGTVWISGGVTPDGAAPGGGERYDPDHRTFRAEPLSPAPDPVAPDVTGSLPGPGATAVPLDPLIAVRFATLLDGRTLTPYTVFLSSVHGLEAIQVVPAEAGRLVFLRPEARLAPDTEYAATLNGPKTADGQALPLAEIRFRTTTAPGGGGPGEGGPGGGPGSGPGGDPGGTGLDWVPASGSGGDGWRMDAAPSPWQGLAPLLAPPGVTALGGQVLTLHGDPLADVTVRIAAQVTPTDATGRFLLADLAPGPHEVLIDGRTATRPGRVYGVFAVGVELTAGRTTVLPYTIWMPRIDTRHAVTIDSPTTQEVVITSPYVPGLEVRIPANTVITDHQHRPVRQVSLTPIPIDRPPFPLAEGVIPPAYFTIQPGAGYVYNTERKGARVLYPNTFGWARGLPAQFWQYDTRGKGWQVYGFGSVTEDGRQVAPGPGIGIYRFLGAMANDCPQYCPGEPEGPSKAPMRADPVNPATGRFRYQKTDLAVPDVIPITLTRTYRTGDPNPRAFGIGTLHAYSPFLWYAVRYSDVDVVFPDGVRLRFGRIFGTDAVPGANIYEHTATPDEFYKARLAYNPADTAWNLTRKDGTVYVFAGQAPLQAIRDRFGNTLTITRSGGPGGPITRITSPNGRWIDFAYDASTRITQLTDNIGRTVQYTYDASGRLATVTDAAGGVTSYTYDTSHRMLTITDPRGITYLTNEYDANGRVFRQTQADGTTYQLAYTLDGSGKVIQTDVTDPRGIVERLTFDAGAGGWLLTDTRALGLPEQQTTTITREAGSNAPLTLTDALGRQTAYIYDDRKNVTSVTRLAGTPDAVTTTYTYEPTYSQVTSITDPLNRTTTFTYDAKGALATITNPLSQQTVLTVNAAGQPTSVRDPLSNTMQLSYDFGDLITVTDPLENTTRRFLDGGGRLVAQSDSLGRTTRYEYDALNRLTRITDPKSGATTFTYDGNGNLLSVTDARSNPTTYTYNSMDRLVTRTDPLLHAETYAYDNNGNLSQVTDRKSQVTTFAYDGLDRRTQATYTDTSTTSFTYDAGNRLTTVADLIAGTMTRTYDGLDRLTQETTPQGTVSYGYDAARRRSSMTVAGQAAVGYTYDTGDRLTQITQGSASVGFAYDADSRRTSLTLPNGIVVESTYDTASRLSGLTYKLGGTTLGTLTYTYDAAGNRALVGGTWARTGLPAAVASASYNASNQQLGFSAATMSYDLNGNLATLTDGSGTTTYTWTARDQLGSLSGPGLIASFSYDGLGRRWTKTIGGARTDFLYDGLNPVQEGVLPGTVSGNVLTGLGIDEYFTRTDAAGTRSLIPDALGSTLALTDAAGAIQTEYTYEPFGRTAVAGASSTNAFQYTGRENDQTGLYYYRARYYHPGLARLIAEDPIEFAGADSNLYSYAGNAPTQSSDSLGLQAVPIPAPLPIPVPLPPVFIPGTPENQRFCEVTIELLKSLMGRRQRETGLENVPNEEIMRRARDRTLPPEERRRYQREEKNRGLRNPGKDRGGPIRPRGFVPFDPGDPSSPAPDLSGRKPCNGHS